MLELQRIEQRVRISAPQSRMWQAIANSATFGAWFGVKHESLSWNQASKLYPKCAENARS